MSLNKIIVRSWCACQRYDTVTLLIFIKRSGPGAVFHSESFQRPAHNENKISCLNFTRIIITKRHAVAPRKNTVAGYDGHLRANVTGKKAEGISARAAPVSIFSFFFFCKMRNLKVRLCYHNDEPNTNVDLANTNASVAESHVTSSCKKHHDSKFCELFIRNCATW